MRGQPARVGLGEPIAPLLEEPLLARRELLVERFVNAAKPSGRSRSAMKPEGAQFIRESIEVMFISTGGARIRASRGKGWATLVIGRAALG